MRPRWSPAPSRRWWRRQFAREQARQCPPQPLRKEQGKFEKAFSESTSVSPEELAEPVCEGSWIGARPRETPSKGPSVLQKKRCKRKGTRGYNNSNSRPAGRQAQAAARGEEFALSNRSA